MYDRRWSLAGPPPQGRRPIYRTSVGQWHHFEQELAALITRLAVAGY